MSDVDRYFHEVWLGMVQPIDGLVVSIPVLVDAQCMERQPPHVQQKLLGLCPPTREGEAGPEGFAIADLGRFFSVTGVLLIVVAAGILAYGVHDLQEAAILPGLTTLAFDVSGAIPPSSWYGTLLKGVLNFSPASTVLEVGVWVAYVAVVMTLFLRPARPTSPAPAAAPAAAHS